MKYIYTFNSVGDRVICKSNFVSVSKKEYDDIVDRSQFRPDSENTRIFQLTGSGAQGNPSYDKDEPSDIAVMIRSGKFDKAEVANIMRNRAKEFQQENDDKIKAEKQKELDSIRQARQAYLDARVGFTGNPQGGVDNA